MIVKDPPGEMGLGTRVDTVPRRVDLAFEVTEYDRPNRLVILVADGGRGVSNTYSLEAEGDTTVVTFRAPHPGHRRFGLLDAIDHARQRPLMSLGLRRLERRMRRDLEHPG